MRSARTPAETVMIGDTSYDMLMARAASVPAIGVGWGYHEAAELIEAGADAVAEDFGALLRSPAPGQGGRRMKNGSNEPTARQALL